MSIVSKVSHFLKSRKKQPFLITSCGQAGVIWLGSMLHKHPEILCSTGTDHPLLSLNYGYNQNEIVNIRNSIKTPKDISYGVTLFLADLLKQGGFFLYGGPFSNINYDHLFTAMDGVALRDDSFKKYIFNELQGVGKLKKYKVYGNVRGLGARDYLFEMTKKHPFDGYGKNMRVADLIRHPITRLDSVINWCHSSYTVNAGFKEMIDDAIKNKPELLLFLEKNYDVDFELDINKLFIYVEFITQHSLSWAHDISATTSIPRILFERLREDRTYFSDLINFISAGVIEAGNDYLDEVFSPDNLASGRMTGDRFRKDRKNPRDVFESWPDWQQQAVRKLFHENQIQDVYKNFDYDLSFL